MSTASKAAMTCYFILAFTLLTIVSIYTAVVFCERENKWKADCAAELLGSLVNITSAEAKNQCILDSQGQFYTYGITIISYVLILLHQTLTSRGLGECFEDRVQKEDL